MDAHDGSITARDNHQLPTAPVAFLAAGSASATGSTDPGDAPDVSAILARAAQGDEQAWRQVIARYARRVYALAKSRVKSPELAEEITQSVLATVASKLVTGGYTEQGKFEPWLFRVVMNRIRDEARRTARQAAPTDPAALHTIPATNPSASRASASPDAHLLPALRLALAQLSDPDRDIIELRHHAQMSFKAMADLLNEPLGTLLARHHRALKKLHTLLTAAPASPTSAQAPHSEASR